MAGTVAGGKKTAKTNKERHGSDFYKKIGAKGGSSSNTGGFASDRELASAAGKLGAQNRWKKTKFDEGNGLEIKKPPLLTRLGKTINVRG